MTRKFDVNAIGKGSAASAVASRCREAGWQVAIVDSKPFGGTCALRGCDPKKVLVGVAESVDWTRRMKGKGIQAAKLEDARIIAEVRPTDRKLSKALGRSVQAIQQRQSSVLHGHTSA